MDLVALPHSLFVTSRWKRYAHGVGSVLALIGVAFVVRQLVHYGSSVELAALPMSEWVTMSAMVFLGVGMNASLGAAWRVALRASDVHVGLPWAVATYAATHIARYVPGNVFHYAGRHAVGVAAGLPGRALVRAAVTEIVLVSISGAFISLLAAPLILPAFQGPLWQLSVIALTGVAGGLLYRLRGREIATAFVLYLTYLTLSAMTFLVVVAIHAPQGSMTGHAWIAICAAYVAAWLIGMLTPGAPAGLGVRELVVLFLLGKSMDASTLLFAVLATRAIAIIADTMAWLAALALRHYHQEPRA
jgi:hypothetical protein